MNHPYIFLDIDGVINPQYPRPKYNVDMQLPSKLAKLKNAPEIADLNIYLVNMVYNSYDPQSLFYLKQLVEEYDAKIVLTSSWRIIYSLETMKTIFSIYDLEDYLVDETKNISPRYQAIQDYVEEHQIESYIVLDDYDMSHFFDYHFIHVLNSFDKENYLRSKCSLQIQG